MSGVPSRETSDEGPGPVIGAKQADAGLDRLLAVVMAARSNMRAALAERVSDARWQESARGRLLSSLEAYTSGLAARGLSAPPVLRDELALQRNLAGRVTQHR